MRNKKNLLKKCKKNGSTQIDCVEICIFALEIEKKVVRRAIYTKKSMRVLTFDKEEKLAIIFIGIQASGKTTFYHRMLSGSNYTHISLDDLHTRNRESQELARCLVSGCSFIIDNTNPTISDRAVYIQKAKEYGYHIIGMFFQSKVKDCVLRNEERGCKVPPKAIACTSNKLQMPSKSEGFDELYFVRITNNNFEITSWRE